MNAEKGVQQYYGSIKQQSEKRNWAQGTGAGRWAGLGNGLGYRFSSLKPGQFWRTKPIGGSIYGL